MEGEQMMNKSDAKVTLVKSREARPVGTDTIHVAIFVARLSSECPTCKMASGDSHSHCKIKEADEQLHN